MGVAVAGGVVPFDELAGSPKFSLGRESRDATRVGKVAWANIDLLALECFPVAPALPGVYPGITFLYADAVEIEPFHPDPGLEMVCTGNTASYDFARVTIKYSRLPYESSTLITRRYSMTGEFMTLPSGLLRWEDQAVGKHINEEDVTAAKIIPSIEHSITWNRVLNSAIPWDAIKANIGKVNDGDLDNAYFPSVTDETLLYLGAELNFTFSTDGSQVWTLEHRFQERRVKSGADVFGWNHFWRPSDSLWKKLLNKDDNNPVYPKSTTFNDLFA